MHGQPKHKTIPKPIKAKRGIK